MKKINILILAAGIKNTAHQNSPYPQYLTEFDGETVLDILIKKAKPLKGSRFSFAFSANDIKDFSSNKIAEILVPDSRVVEVPDGTKGSACTALLACCNLPLDEELLIVCANEIVDVDLQKIVNKFREEEYSAGTVTFPSVHPRYSSVLLDGEKNVLQVSQRKPISKHATTGIFWFQSVGLFMESVKNMIRKCAHLDGKYYVALSMNEIILKQQAVGVYQIEKERYHPLKDEKQISNFEIVGIH